MIYCIVHRHGPSSLAAAPACRNTATHGWQERPTRASHGPALQVLPGRRSSTAAHAPHLQRKSVSTAITAPVNPSSNHGGHQHAPGRAAGLGTVRAGGEHKGVTAEQTAAAGGGRRSSGGERSGAEIPCAWTLISQIRPDCISSLPPWPQPGSCSPSHTVPRVSVLHLQFGLLKSSGVSTDASRPSRQPEASVRSLCCAVAGLAPAPAPHPPPTPPPSLDFVAAGCGRGLQAGGGGQGGRAGRGGCHAPPAHGQHVHAGRRAGVPVGCSAATASAAAARQLRRGARSRGSR
jgi:hypothetical protein